MTDLIQGVLGGVGGTFFRVGVLVIAAVSLVVIAILLVKSTDSMVTHRRR
jgi:hypothetical protein